MNTTGECRVPRQPPLERPLVVHFDPLPVGGPHPGPLFTDDPRKVTCQACRTGLVAAVRAGREAGERQVWEQKVPGTDLPLTRIHLEVDNEGRVRLHESIAAQLLTDAGWERTT